ncbi:MAG: radical SAM protein, partial [Paludibacteraceae bacterium]|nr:radical SAM protein [Paludibacteraceae bacterium]
MSMLFNEIAYGPIRSRRLGVSLGMEIMPLTHKLCTFDCIYCECGWNQPISHPVLPTREEVRKALEEKLALMQKEDADLDVITFSGNGEPTLHPHFLGIIEDTCMLRNQYYPNA